MRADFKIEKKVIESFFNYAQRVNEECVIVITKNEWHIRVMDASHISMMDISMQKESFDEYDLDFDNYNDTELKIGVNVEEVYKIIKGTVSKDPIIINITDDRLYLSDFNKSMFEIPLIDHSEKNTKLPEIPIYCTFKIDGTILKNIIKNAKKVSDIITIETISWDEVLFRSKGETTEFKAVLNKNNQNVSNGKMEIEDLELKDKSWGTYNIGYLEPITKAFGRYIDVKISLCQDMPIQLEILEDDGKMSIKYILAPRIERDSDDYKKPYELPVMQFFKLKEMSNIKTIKKFIQNYVEKYHYSYKIPLKILENNNLLEKFEKIKSKKVIDGYLVIYQ